MRPFRERPPEVAALLNPAFCGLLLHDSAAGFRREAHGAAMPFLFIPFVLPLSLHCATRAALPTTTRTKMHAWIQAHPEARISFPQRARSLHPYAMQGLLFATARGWFTFTADGGILTASPLAHKRKHIVQTSEVAACREAAVRVGRWLAHAGTPSTVYAMWGIIP